MGRVKSAKVDDGRLVLRTGTREIVLPDGDYRHHDGAGFTVRDGQLVDAHILVDLDQASVDELEDQLDDLEAQLETIGDDAQLANVDLQNALQRQQQVIQMMSNASKVLHDTALAVIRKIG